MNNCIAIFPVVPGPRRKHSISLLLARLSPKSLCFHNTLPVTSDLALTASSISQGMPLLARACLY